MQNSKKDVRGASMSKKTIVLIVLGAVAVLLAAFILAMFLAGFRYMKLKYLSAADGSEATISYLGFVDRDGALTDGTLFYDKAKAGVKKGEDGLWTLEFSNGDVYVGELDGLQRAGQGKMTYKTGETYEGSFKNDKYHGTGRLTYANGDVYTGQFAGGQKSGEGVYVWAAVNGRSAVYEGSFALDRRNGYGVYTESNGTTYRGCFKDDLREDENAEVTIVTGPETFDRYYGGYKNDKRSGMGLYIYANGDLYSGQFENDTFNGTGVIYRVQGSSFRGTFKDGNIVSGSAEELSKEEADAQREALTPKN